MKEKLLIFNLMLTMKNVRKSYITITIKNLLYMAKIYFKYKVYKKHNWKTWKGGLIMYCIDNMLTWEQGVQRLLDEKII